MTLCSLPRSLLSYHSSIIRGADSQSLLPFPDHRLRSNTNCIVLRGLSGQLKVDCCAAASRNEQSPYFSNLKAERDASS
jgi:hypothetical protein